MNLDRCTARALVDANMMSLKEYIERFGTAEEKEAGQADGLEVKRANPGAPATQEEKASHEFHAAPRKATVIRSLFH